MKKKETIMSYVESQLQPGEQVLFRINRGRKWYHYLFLVLPYLILLPILILVVGFFLLPALAASLPETVLIVIGSGLLLLIGLGILTDVAHFLVDELVLTDKRIVGRAQGAFSAWVFQKINVPLSEIESATSSSSSLVIQRKNGKPDLIVRSLDSRKQFAAKLMELINRIG
jgi:hypothetical protein